MSIRPIRVEVTNVFRSHWSRKLRCRNGLQMDGQKRKEENPAQQTGRCLGPKGICLYWLVRIMVCSGYKQFCTECNGSWKVNPPICINLIGSNLSKSNSSNFLFSMGSTGILDAYIELLALTEILIYLAYMQLPLTPACRPMYAVSLPLCPCGIHKDSYSRMDPV